MGWELEPLKRSKITQGRKMFPIIDTVNCTTLLGLMDWLID
jgi:hypothetical protein